MRRFPEEPPQRDGCSGGFPGIHRCRAIHQTSAEAAATAAREPNDLAAGSGRGLQTSPGRAGSDSYTLLITPEGPTLWRHRAAPFGAAASVWAFCRFADGMVPVARRLLCVPHGHFVDDFTGAELEATAESACSTFRDMFQELGLCMKESKEQPPKTRQKVLGVIITVRDDAMMVEACPQRQQNSLGCWTKWNSTTR